MNYHFFQYKAAVLLLNTTLSKQLEGFVPPIAPIANLHALTHTRTTYVVDRNASIEEIDAIIDYSDSLVRRLIKTNRVSILDELVNKFVELGLLTEDRDWDENEEGRFYQTLYSYQFTCKISDIFNQLTKKYENLSDYKKETIASLLFVLDIKNKDIIQEYIQTHTKAYDMLKLEGDVLCLTNKYRIRLFDIYDPAYIRLDIIMNLKIPSEIEYIIKDIRKENCHDI